MLSAGDLPTESNTSAVFAARVTAIDCARAHLAIGVVLLPARPSNRGVKRAPSARVCHAADCRQWADHPPWWRKLPGGAKKENARGRSLSPGWYARRNLEDSGLLLCLLLGDGKTGLLESLVAEHEGQLIGALGFVGFAFAHIAAEGKFRTLDFDLGRRIQLATGQRALGLLDLFGRDELVVALGCHLGVLLFGRERFRAIATAEVDFCTLEVDRSFRLGGHLGIHDALDALEANLRGRDRSRDHYRNRCNR